MNSIQYVQVSLWVLGAEDDLDSCLYWNTVPDRGESLTWDGVDYRIDSRSWGTTVRGNGEPLGNLCCTLTLVPQIYSEEAPEQGPLESIQTTMSTDPRDWGMYKRDAWLFAIVLGWEDDDGTPGEALREVAAKHRWTEADLRDLMTLRTRFKSLLADEKLVSHRDYLADGYTICETCDGTVKPNSKCETCEEQDEQG